MILYFEDGNRNKRAISEEVENREDACKLIKEFCDERNYEIPYYRTWSTRAGETYFDVGSWSEFFILYDPVEALKERVVK